MSNQKYNYHKRNNHNLYDYVDSDLPFCAYGIFKPGQLAYSKIKKYVEKIIPSEIKYQMLLRDGVPLINPEKSGSTKVFLIYFKKGCGEYAYNIIRDTEREELYYWKKIRVDNIETNILMGHDPYNGSYYPEYDTNDFKGEKDPFFKEVIDLIEENLDKQTRHSFGEEFENTIKDFFTLQMNYMLLWSAIERFTSLKYNKSKGENNRSLANEPIFKKALKKHVIEEGRVVYSAEDMRRFKLTTNNSTYAIKYYYTLRCNMVHRGKAAPQDMDIIKTSLEELLNIFKDILNDTFKE